MNTSSVKVLPTSFVVGGWRGELTIDGDVLTVTGDGQKTVTVDMRTVTRASFNSGNGLWVFRFAEGGPVRFQSAGGMLSADRTPAGKAANEEITKLLARHKIKGFRI